MGPKIRNLFDDPMKEDICYTDVINAFVEGIDYIQKLECNNSMHSLKKARSVINIAKIKLREFEARIKDEVVPEITEADNKRKASNPPKVGNPLKVIEANNKRWNRKV